MHDIIEHYGKVIVARACGCFADGCGCKDCEYQDDNGGR